MTMTHYSLGRQAKGRIAELVAQGLHGGLHDLMEETVENHVRDRYDDLLQSPPVRIKKADVNSYRWSSVIPVSVPGDIGWRPDFFIKATWTRSFSGSDPPGEEFWAQDLPPVHCRVHRRPRLLGRVEEELRCTFTVYYPVEVKSGDKKTLTEQQASSIPAVVNHVDNVHPLIATVEIDDLPDSYCIKVDEFATSAWADNSGVSRYRS